jgi:hypothetical protein
VLDAERRRTGEQLDILGSKIPARVISQAGVFILAVLQLYFFLHLRHVIVALEFSTHYRLNVAWIGFYGDKLSLLVTRLSVFAVPITSLYLIISFLREYSGQYFLAPLLVGIGLCTFCGSVVTYKAVRRLRGFFIRPG